MKASVIAFIVSFVSGSAFPWPTGRCIAGIRSSRASRNSAAPAADGGTRLDFQCGQAGESGGGCDCARSRVLVGDGRWR